MHSAWSIVNPENKKSISKKNQKKKNQKFKPSICIKTWMVASSTEIKIEEMSTRNKMLKRARKRRVGREMEGWGRRERERRRGEKEGWAYRCR